MARKRNAKPVLEVQTGSAYETVSEDLDFERALVVEELVWELVSDYHQHLSTACIVCVFTKNAPVDKGKALFMDVKKVSGLSAWLSGLNGASPFFVILVHGATWITSDKQQQRMAVDEQLCKLWQDPKGRITIRPYEFRGFVAIANRYGISGDDMERIVRCAAKKSGYQLVLAGVDEPEALPEQGAADE